MIASASGVTNSPIASWIQSPLKAAPLAPATSSGTMLPIGYASSVNTRPPRMYQLET